MDELAERGVTCVPLLDRRTLRSARGVVDELRLDDGIGFWTSNQHAERAVASRLNDQLLELTDDAVRSAFPGHRAVKAVVLFKGPVGNNWVDAHQDWEYVDERSHRAQVVFCPLVDVDVEDGALHVVAGSHRELGVRRGSGSFPMPFLAHTQALLTAAEPFPVEAGTGVAYDNAAVHLSPPNDGRRARPALALEVVPIGAPVIHLHSDDGARADLYRVDPRSFTQREFGAAPEGEPVSQVDIGSLDGVAGLLARAAG